MLAAGPQVGDRVLLDGNVWMLVRPLARGRWEARRGRVQGIVLTTQLCWNASWRGWLVENEDHKG